MSNFSFEKVRALIAQTPDLQQTLAPLKSYLQASPSKEPLGFPLKKMGLWLWGMSEAHATLLGRWCPETSAEEQCYFDHVKEALARDPEPPIEWLERGIRHINRWLETGSFSFAGYYTLRRLHFLTRGYSTLWLRFLHQYYLPIPQVQKPDLAMPQKHLQSINTKGYTLFNQQLSKKTLQAVRQFAQQTPCHPAYHEQDAIKRPPLLFNEHHPVARRYDFDSQELWNCPEIQEIAAQEQWFNYASDFLKSPAKLVQAYFWWSVATDLPESRTTGQVFHVDIDRFHFVNCFFYLTDVNHSNGPQQYIRGSQSPVPLSLAIDKRWTEKELLAVYGNTSLETVTGQAGSMIMGDTRAFHRGKPLEQGARLMLQLEFASSTLSDPAPVIDLPKNCAPALAHAVQHRPERYPIFKTLT